MEITQTNSAPQAGASSPPAQSSTSVISSDFETFLRLLTTQMENQDPLNPIESADFAVQLATFSGVEQQVKTNDLLGNMIGRMGAGDLAQVAGWVGMEARAAAPVYFDGTPIRLETVTDPAADASTLIARDETGRVVQRLDIPPGGGEVLWEGQEPGAGRFLDGLYSFEVENRIGETVLSTTPVEVYARVSEARMEAGEIVVIFDGGGSAPASAVTAIRDPGAG